MKTNNLTPKEYKGCFKSPSDNRDYVLGAIVYESDPKAPDFATGYDVEKRYGKLKREHQGSSLSCTQQAVSKYLEMLHKIELTEKQYEITIADLSGKSWYPFFRLKNGGAFLRDAMKYGLRGCPKEKLIPSYENGKNPTERFMSQKVDNKLIRTDALIYKPKKYVKIDVKFPLTDQDWEDVRQVIWQFGGFVSGYARHAQYFCKYKLINGKRAIGTINSYGEGSDQWYVEGTRYELFDLYFYYNYFNLPYATDMKLDKIPVNKELRDRLYRIIFHRKPDAKADTHIGHNLTAFLNSVEKSGEFKFWDKIIRFFKFIKGDFIKYGK